MQLASQGKGCTKPHLDHGFSPSNAQTLILLPYSISEATLLNQTACIKSFPTYLYPSKNKLLQNHHSVNINKKSCVIIIFHLI